MHLYYLSKFSQQENGDTGLRSKRGVFLKKLYLLLP